MFKVKIFILGYGNEIESEIDITSDRSLSAAKNKATRWINKNLFASDINNINKEQISKHSQRATWWIH